MTLFPVPGLVAGLADPDAKKTEFPLTMSPSRKTSPDYRARLQSRSTALLIGDVDVLEPSGERPPRSMTSFVRKRWPSPIRSISIAMASNACATSRGSGLASRDSSSRSLPTTSPEAVGCFLIRRCCAPRPNSTAKSAWTDACQGSAGRAANQTATRFTRQRIHAIGIQARCLNHKDSS
jgi:hypothetical protein